ncbi:MAG: LamG domain-containing protein [Spirochaetia bacterium]|nr:LamG domain-containing protein [Spirochaetia bacterium]
MRKILTGILILSFWISWGLLAANDPSLVGSWSFDETSGTNAADGSGSGLNGHSSAAWAAGKIGGAVLLDGDKTRLIRITLPSEKQFGRSSFTVACWIHPNRFDIESTQKQRRFFGFEKWPDYFVVGDVMSDGKLNFSVGGRSGTNAPGVNASLYAKDPVPLKEWTHVVMVCDRETGVLRVYINGFLSSVLPVPQNFSESVNLSGDKPVTVGSIWQSFDGLVDELKIWKRVLKPDEARAVYQGK